MSPPFGNAPAAVLCFNADIIEVQMRRTTPTLKPGATAKDVMWELAQLFPSSSPSQLQ